MRISHCGGITKQILLVGLLLVCGSQRALGQLLAQDIVVPDIYEELYRIDPITGAATDLLNSPITQEVFAQEVAILDKETIYLAAFQDLYRYDVLTGNLSFVDELSFDPLEITPDNGGNLIAVEANEIFRIDPTTGAETSLYTDTFFGPQDAVVDLRGNIYVTEFFDGLGVLSPSGGFSRIGNFSTNLFQHVDISPDGLLYLSTTSGGSFFRVDPSTGVGMQLDSGVFTFIEDLQADANGDIVFAGQVGFETGVFRFDTTTNDVTAIATNETINDGFFNPGDIEIFSGFVGADFDRNGTVNTRDLVFILVAYGEHSGGDADRDGDTDGADFLLWQRQHDAPAGLHVSHTVPEPTSLALLMMAIVLGCRTSAFVARG